MSARVHACAECGASTDLDRFCGSACRTAFNNRRKARGAELYDLYMAHRFEREPAREARVFQAINRLASNWREEDRRERDSRPSWRCFRDVLADRPYLRAIVRHERFGRRSGVAA